MSNGMPKTGKCNDRKLVRPIQNKRALDAEICLNLWVLVPWRPEWRVYSAQVELVVNQKVDHLSGKFMATKFVRRLICLYI
jgi:hypothetical protein